MTTRTTRCFLVAAAAIAASAGAASATNFSVDWMQMSPTPFGSAPPFASSYFLPGVGVVGMTYSAHPDFIEGRLSVPQLASGSVTSGPDTYSWTQQECLARTNLGSSGVLNSSWFVTYTFPTTLAPGTIVLGVQGLGRRTPSNPGETVFDTTSTATVLNSGTYLGDFTGAMNVGATQFSGGIGSFSMENSVTGIGGIDPWWNTGLALVRIDDPVSSLTVRFNHTSGDGVGVNIGVIPAPGALALMGVGGLALGRRRR